jgi:hypothetical protein
VKALDRIEFAGAVDFFRAAPAELAERYGIRVEKTGTATCVGAAGLPGVPMINRALGLGQAREATDDEIARIAEFFRELGVRFYLPVSPGARPEDLEARLAARGFERGYGWAKFRRDTKPFKASTELRVDLATVDEAEAFGRVVAEGYGLPRFAADWCAALVERPGWSCYVSWDGKQPAGAGALYVEGENGWLSFAATRERFRRRGSQGAILAARIRDAAVLGCKTLVTETGELVEDRPSNSYRNILRSGFELAYVRPNYVLP